MMKYAAALFFLAASLAAGEPKELESLRAQHAQSASVHTESERVDYVLRLARLREQFASDHRTADWKAVDTEIRRNPAPKDSDRQGLSRLLVGTWASPRHDYLYRVDGTWTMLPETIDDSKSTHGKWHIEGNQFSSTVSTDPPETLRYTIILITQERFIFTDGESVFYESRQ